MIPLSPYGYGRFDGSLCNQQDEEEEEEDEDDSDWRSHSLKFSKVAQIDDHMARKESVNDYVVSTNAAKLSGCSCLPRARLQLLCVYVPLLRPLIECGFACYFSACICICRCMIRC